MSIDATSLSAEAQHLLEAALRLPDAQRVLLADHLYSSIEGAEAEKLFEGTIARRVAEIEAGTANLHTWDELQQMMRDTLHAARKV